MEGLVREGVGRFEGSGKVDMSVSFFDEGDGSCLVSCLGCAFMRFLAGILADTFAGILVVDMSASNCCECLIALYLNINETVSSVDLVTSMLEKA